MMITSSIYTRPSYPLHRESTQEQASTHPLRHVSSKQALHHAIVARHPQGQHHKSNQEYHYCRNTRLSIFTTTEDASEVPFDTSVVNTSHQATVPLTPSKGTPSRARATLPPTPYKGSLNSLREITKEDVSQSARHLHQSPHLHHQEDHQVKNITRQCLRPKTPKSRLRRLKSVSLPFLRSGHTPAHFTHFTWPLQA